MIQPHILEISSCQSSCQSCRKARNYISRHLSRYRKSILLPAIIWQCNYLLNAKHWRKGAEKGLKASLPATEGVTPERT
ncbi:hypothetical protein PUN28_005209 [Cardiocondyla obscurior]|uniref:Uncharacterized protein n=1 Tax=Cardiocondyla obscurior TaxID=286306 RepID=A0AAW2GHH4_9HYME